MGQIRSFPNRKKSNKSQKNFVNLFIQTWINEKVNVLFTRTQTYDSFIVFIQKYFAKLYTDTKNSIHSLATLSILKS